MAERPTLPAALLEAAARQIHWTRCGNNLSPCPIREQHSADAAVAADALLAVCEVREEWRQVGPDGFVTTWFWSSLGEHPPGWHIEHRLAVTTPAEPVEGSTDG